MSVDWEAYSDHAPDSSGPQWDGRVKKILDRSVGSVLDIGGGDGTIAADLMAQGHAVTMVEVSAKRRARAEAKGVTAVEQVSPGAKFDTVLLAEVLEHQDNPGPLLAEAFWRAEERVVITLPLNGWPDPTHRWRVSVDTISHTHPAHPGGATEQIVLTFQRGACWPQEYWRNDPTWRAQFEKGR